MAIPYTFTAGTTIVSDQMDANFAVCLLTQTAGTVTVTHTFTASQTFTGGLTFGTSVISTTALATPSTLSATQCTAFASTLSGATLMGYGTTHDVTLKNRAGTSVLGVLANTTNVQVIGNLGIASAATYPLTIKLGTDQNFGVRDLSGTTNLVVINDALTAAVPLTVTVSTLSVGYQGGTNPAFLVDSSTVPSATGVKITAAAAASGVAVAVISSGANENLTIDAKGSGTITLNATGTGAIVLTRATTISGTLTAAAANFSSAVSATESVTITSAAGIPFTQLTATTGTNAVHHRLTNTGGTYYFAVENSAGSGFGAVAYAMVLYTPAGLALQLDKTTNAATFGASITTSAPTGGAGAWELGIANAVSPTSPNRTLTVEIGGTAYYIAAKTTND